MIRRRLGWTCLGVAVAVVTVFAASRLARPRVNLLGLHVVATSRFVSLTVASESISGDGERWAFANGATAIIGPRSLWRPSRMSATLSTVSWTGTVRGVFVPWRFILPVVALLALLGGGLVRRGRIRHGACRRCGYDLSGSRSSRCPECGTTVEAAAAGADAPAR